MEQLLGDIGNVLAVRNFWDIFVYLILLMSFITLMLIPDKNMGPTMLMYVVLLMCVVDKVRDSGELPLTGFDDQGFGTMMIHIGMALFPIMAGAMVRAREEKQKRAMPVGILTGILALVYAIAFFFANT